MADLAASQVTVVRSWTECGTTGKERRGMLVKITTGASPGQGSASNLVLASALGLTKVESCSNFYEATNGLVVPAVPYFPDGSAVFLTNLNQATDGNRADPADFIEVDLYGEIHGY